MYRFNKNGQLDIYDFILPFGGHLDEENRWVRLRKMIDWDAINEEYSKQFENKDEGNDALPSDVAFGSLYIQRKLWLSDRELVAQVTENPYMQYFIGYKEYSSRRPFDPSLMVTFRKRLPEETMCRIIEKMFIGQCESDGADAGDGEDGTGGGGGGGKTAEDDGDDADDKTAADASDNVGKSEPESAKELPNKGTLIIDATCAPADIAYPTDLELCDKARSWTERIIDRYWRM